jgi:hypothetical protein
MRKPDASRPRSRLSFLLATASVGALAALVAAGLSAGSAGARAAASAPANAVTPAIVGTAVVGQTLTTTSGSWAGDNPIAFAYQWRRCTEDGTGCVDVAGATGPTRMVVSGDVGSRLRVQVTASNAAGSAAVQSAATAVVALKTAPANVREPAIRGSAVEGQTLTGTNGDWKGTMPLTYAYRWVRCPADGGAADGSNCRNVPNATGLTHVLEHDDVGLRLRLRVTATGPGGVQTAASNATRPIAASSTSGAPKNTVEPSVSGSARQGQTLTARVGSWTGATPIAYAYQWLRCNAAAGNCVALAGQTKPSYVVASTDLSSRLRVRVTASNPRGSATATSNATAQAGATGPVIPADAVRLPSGKYSVPVASVALPARLIVDQVAFAPGTVRSRSTPIELRVHVVDTRGYAVRGALVFARSTPLVTTTAADQQTGQDGWATLQLSPTSAFPLRKGHNVQFFVRARKAGDNLLAGVSTRRLVQVRTAR